MGFEYSSNTGAVQAQLRELGTRIERAQLDAAKAGGAVLLIESQRALDALIYDQPIPLRRSRDGGRRPAWKRTGALRRGERTRFERLSDGARVSLDNAAPYAIRRALLKKPSPVDGRTREANWRARAKSAGAGRAADATRAAFNRALGAMRA